MTTTFPRPQVLIILDGWGHNEDTQLNAISAAKKPNWDHIWEHYPHTVIAGSGHAVGLPRGQMGNSEVGHLNMGAGRIVHQDLTRIDLAIEKGDFFQNEILLSALTKAKKSNQAIHVMGLLSPGGVHSHEKHFHALLKLAATLKIPKLYIHAFLDGRDTPPRSARHSIEKLESLCQKHHCGKIVSIIGRYFAMDRDKRWDRIQKAYDLIVAGKSEYHAETAIEALEMAYARSESDEFVQATAIHPKDDAAVKINDGDTLLFMNFRSDRARELTEAFIDLDFHNFVRIRKPKFSAFICFCEYDKRFALPTLFPPQSLKNIFAEYISQKGLKQLRIAETEKYAHVTFFFNAGIEKPYPGEDRILIPSPKVTTYDLQPEMSAPELTDRLVKEIKNQKYDVIICNFANPDMVGHTGNFDATVKAIQIIDACLGKILKALKEVGGELIITADHGNAEQMFDYTTNQPHTAHTSQPVPFIYIGRKAEITDTNGKLSDIAPTLLYLMGISKPSEMTGKSLLKIG